MAFASKSRNGKASKASRKGEDGGEQLQRTSSRYPARTRPDKPVAPAPGGAKRYMMWLLARREYAAVDLRKKALSKGHLPDEVEAALQSFQALGLQDDTRYAGMKARQCAPRYGNRRVAQVLKTKNIDSEIVSQQLDELPDEAVRAARLLEQFASSVWDQALQQKVWRRLATRGFSTSVIKTALATLKLQCAQAACDREDEAAREGTAE